MRSAESSFDASRARGSSAPTRRLQTRWSRFSAFSGDGDCRERRWKLSRLLRTTSRSLEAEVEAIRGVQTSGTIQTLQEANLVRVVGQKESLGNPYLYGTTDEFLRYFGLADASELPPLEFEREGIRSVVKAVEAEESMSERKEESRRKRKLHRWISS